MADLIVTSKGGLFPHTHTLTIPAALLAAPPNDGALLKTSANYSLIFKHGHEVKLSESDLKNIAAGIEITVTDHDKGRHRFTICLR